MEVIRASSVRAFVDVAGEFLAAREAEHNLMYGIMASIEADPTQYGQPYFATILHGDRVVGAAIRTPPWRLALSMFDHPGAMHRLADDLVHDRLPGVVGPAESAQHFTEAWTGRTRATTSLVRTTRAFQLSAVARPRPAGGGMVAARPGDRALLRDWASAFHAEAIAGGPPQDFEAMADRWSRGIGRMAYLWVDQGRPVSLACVGGPTPNGIRVGPVYTPPEARGRGYASNLVADASQAQLDAGRRYVFLFTDLANPTSNKIYQAIGYEPVLDYEEHDFG